MPVSSVVRTSGHPRYSQTMPCSTESAEPARQLIRTALCAWGLEGLADDGALVITELVANAAQHTHGHLIRVSISRPAPGLVRIDVVDRSKIRPQLRDADDYSERGRGLYLIELLADRWGSDLLPFGKRVWAVLTEEPTV